MHCIQKVIFLLTNKILAVITNCHNNFILANNNKKILKANKIKQRK